MAAAGIMRRLMSEMLSQLFDKYLGGECSPEVFERELLALCSSSPDRAWQGLALLDRFYRQHKISDRFCRTLREQIGARAMRLEGHAVEQPPLPQSEPDPLFAATMASAAAASGAYRAVATAPDGHVPAARAPAAAASLTAAAPAAVAAPAPAPLAAPAMAQEGAQADANSLADAGVETLLTMPTVPVVRERDRAQQPRVPNDANPTRWRRGFQTSPALGLIAVVLGVAASTRVQDPPERLEPITPDVATVVPPASDSDHDPAVVSLSTDRYLVQPEQKTVEFTVERTSGSGDASFVWWTQPSSAKSSEDYIGTRARVVAIPEGTTSMKLQVPILENPQRRHIDMFYVVIGNSDGGAELGAIRRAAVFIFPSERH